MYWLAAFPIQLQEHCALGYLNMMSMPGRRGRCNELFRTYLANKHERVVFATNIPYMDYLRSKHNFTLPINLLQQAHAWYALIHRNPYTMALKKPPRGTSNKWRGAMCVRRVEPLGFGWYARAPKHQKSTRQRQLGSARQTTYHWYNSKWACPLIVANASTRTRRGTLLCESGYAWVSV